MTTDTIHENSLLAFRALINDGTISEARLIAAHALWQHPSGMTANELDRHLSPGVINSRYSRRLIELERRGLIARAGARKCSVSGNRCDVWVYAPHVPAAAPLCPRMPSPEEAALLTTALDMTQPVASEMSDALRVLLAWLAAGAPRTRDARRVPERRKNATLAEVFATQDEAA